MFCFLFTAIKIFQKKHHLSDLDLNRGTKESVSSSSSHLQKM